MRRRSPMKWVRGVTLELFGVAVIIWIATGAPLPSSSDFSPPASIESSGATFHFPRSIHCQALNRSVVECPTCG